MSEWCDVWWETMPKGQLRKFTPHMHVIKIFVSSPLPSMKCTPVTHNQALLHCSGRYLRTVHPLWSLPFLTWSLLKCKLTIRKKKEAEEAWNEKLFPRRKWRAFAELPKLSQWLALCWSNKIRCSHSATSVSAINLYQELANQSPISFNRLCLCCCFSWTLLMCCMPTTTTNEQVNNIIVVWMMCILCDYLLFYTINNAKRPSNDATDEETHCHRAATVSSLILRSADINYYTQ